MEEINYELSRKASGILSLIGQDELIWLLDEMYELFDMYNCAEQVNRELGEDVGEAELFRLIETARILSRIADKLEKPFRKIKKKFAGFDRQCSEIVSMEDFNDQCSRIMKEVSDVSDNLGN